MCLSAIYLEFKQISFFFSQIEQVVIEFSFAPKYLFFWLFLSLFICFFCFCQQILEEQDFKEEDFGLFQLAGQRCLDEGHIDQLFEIIQNEKNKVSTIVVCTFQSLGKRTA